MTIGQWAVLAIQNLDYAVPLPPTPAVATRCQSVGIFATKKRVPWSAVVPRCVRLCTLPPPSLRSRPPSRLRHLPPALMAAREVCGADLVSLLTPATVIPKDVNSTRSCSMNTRKDGRNKRVRHGQNGGL